MPESSFDAVAALYKFDSELRLLALSAIEKLEIAIRSKIAYHLAAVDACAHLNEKLMHVKFLAPIVDEYGEAQPSGYDRWQSQHLTLISRSKEDFIKHFREKYVPPVPIWVSIEVWDFGLLSYFFSGLNDKDKAVISKCFGIDRFVLLASWLRSMSHLRNICAHHSRLWNRALTDNPKAPGRNEIPDLEHLRVDTYRIHVYGTFAIMQHLMKGAGFGGCWADKLKSLIGSFPAMHSAATISAMGFPENWMDLELWQGVEEG